ncbi:MAG: alpha-glycosidase [Butyrivibrio sp.]|nr:alpha-glycosidase [Butyrivibrio sp.]
MNDWLNSVYSDGTRGFLSNPHPKTGENIKVYIRFCEGAPVKNVLLWHIVNGAEAYIDMTLDHVDGGLSYYCAELRINEPRVQYHFVITTMDTVFFYTQNGITTYVPDYRHDFIILTDYIQPSWVKGAVFYQIFPERFYNGDESNDVRDGEYEYRGSKCYKVDNWDERPESYDKTRSMDFYGGDLEGIVQKIPYLKELGITVVYLNPIFTSYSTHKYDCIDYFHVDPHFGGDEALERLSGKLHENGIRIILDISINHTGIEHNWVKEGREFYFRNGDGSLMGWAGYETLPVLNYRSNELRDLIYRGKDSVLRKWLRPPYNIDGWRFDVADVMARNDEVQLADEVWREVCEAIRQEKEDAFIIGEHWADCSEYLQGNRWNTPMNYFGYGRIIRQFAGLPDLFLMRIPKLAEVHYKMTASDVVSRTDEHFSLIPQVIADCQMNLFDSHDVSRVHNYESISFDKWKSVVISQLLWTGIPCIYYGDELAIDGFTENDAGFRFPMPWDRKNENTDRHYRTYKRMIELRKGTEAFSEGGRKVLFADGQILAIARFMNDEKYVGIISMEEQQREICVPIWEIGAFETESNPDEFGCNISAVCSNGEMKIIIPAFGSYVIRVK